LNIRFPKAMVMEDLSPQWPLMRVKVAAKIEETPWWVTSGGIEILFQVADWIALDNQPLRRELATTCD